MDRGGGDPARLSDPLESLVAAYVIEKDWTLLHSSPGYEPFEQHFGLKTPDLGATMKR